MAKSTRRLPLRWFLSILCLLVFTYALIYTLHRNYAISPLEGVDDRPFNELTSESIKTQVEFSRSLFEVGLLVTGALWALIIAKKDEAGVVLDDHPELIMFISASLLLLLSLICHAMYLKEIEYVLGVSGRAFNEKRPSVLDIFNPNIHYLFSSQAWFLGAGIIIAITTLFSAHRLKEA